MIGENIKRIRKSRGLTQIALADKIHVNQTTISSWETNRTEPNMGMIETMAYVLNCSKSDIVGEQHYISPNVAKVAEIIQGNSNLLSLFSSIQQVSLSSMESAYGIMHGRDRTSASLITLEEMMIIDAYRAASTDIKNATCAVLGVKRDPGIEQDADYLDA